MSIAYQTLLLFLIIILASFTSSLPLRYVKRASLSSKMAKGMEKYPYLGFAAYSAGLITANAFAVTQIMKTREDKILKRKKELGLPPIDLTNEKKEIKEALEKQKKQTSKGKVAAKASSNASNNNKNGSTDKGGATEHGGTGAK